MDATDIRLSQLLMVNSRVPYRELASKLGISIQAVHRRMQLLREMGVIRDFVTIPSSEALGAIDIMVFGASRSRSMEDAVSTIGKNEYVDSIYIASGNVLYVGALLHDISELEGVTELVREHGQVPEPNVGIFSARGKGPKERGVVPLTELEYRIIASLRRDSRKSVTDVAAELGVSGRTVNRHIGRMARDGLVAFTIRWFPCACRDIIAMFHVELRPGVDKAAARSALVREHGARIVEAMSFSNLPNFLMLVIWSTSSKEVEDLQRAIESEASVASVMTDILYKGAPFDNWRDALIEKHAKGQMR
jgi:DNA-binding Lrp family transcriptional regulator